MMLLDYAHGNWMQEKPTVIKEKISISTFSQWKQGHSEVAFGSTNYFEFFVCLFVLSRV